MAKKAVVEVSKSDILRRLEKIEKKVQKLKRKLGVTVTVVGRPAITDDMKTR